MIYLTGACTSLTDFRTSVINALTANGWSWNATQQTIAKGSVSAKLALTTGTGYASRITIVPGCGVDGSGNLLTPPSGTTNTPACMIADQFTGVPNYMQSVAWPATYRIFIYTNPDTVVVTLDYNVTYRQYFILGLAKSLGVQGVDGGSNVPFLCATLPDTITTTANIAVTAINNYNSSAPNACAAIPFFYGSTFYLGAIGATSFAYINEPVAFHRNAVSTSPWACNNLGANAAGGQWNPNLGIVNCWWAQAEAYNIQTRAPNQWNGDAVLSPIRPMAARPSNFLSYAFEIQHMRLMRNDYYNDGDFITKGTAKWMVLSVYHKDISNRMGTNLGSVGTFALALEYTDQ